MGKAYSIKTVMEFQLFHGVLKMELPLQQLPPTTRQPLSAGTIGSLAVTFGMATLPIIFPESGRLQCQVQDVRGLLSPELIFGDSFVLSLWRPRP